MKIVRVAGLLCLVLAVPVARAQSGPDWNGRLEKAKYSLSEAMEKGLQEAGEGAVIHAELEQDGGHLVYSIDVAQDDRNCNVVLDVTDGKVVEKDTEHEDNSDAVKACKVSLQQALQTALQEHAGKAVEAQLLMTGGTPTHRICVFAEGKVTCVNIDAVSGKVLAKADREGPKSDSGAEAESDEYTDRFHVDSSEWSSTGVNPWFKLTPGYVLVLEGEEDGETVRLTITVMDETKKVDGVETRVVEEREEADGEVIEISLNYFALSKRDNGVYYFGEDSAEYEDGQVKSRGGSWWSGRDGARYGLLMPGTALLGARYYQEIAPGVAMDRAEVVSLDGKMETPAGRFENVLKTLEDTPLEKGREFKYYAAGVGIIQDGSLKLVKHGMKK
ncbi:MAG: PepSY domain-containing protein [Planctomycetes bacterium]|nr:PepSY domain-containing protein [Planctomycetota bacterium]